MASPSTWSLHAQLQKDTIDIGDLPLSRVLVIKDANYPWLMLVPRRADTVEIIDLDEVEQGQLMTEINRVGRALKEITKCDKLMSQPWATWCRSFTSTSSRAAPRMPPGRGRCGA